MHEPKRLDNQAYLSSDDIEIVISAENNLYCAWQSLVSHYSCVKNLNITPLIVVHGFPHEPLHRHYLTLLEHGGRIQRVLNYRSVGSANYAPRNTAATLLNVKTEAPYIMLCDTDFLFLNPISREVLPKSDNEITFDEISFMTVDREARASLIEPAKKAGLDIDRLASFAKVGGAVPHFIPTHLAKTLGADWLRCIEYFATSRHPIFWLASMWALVFAVQRLKISWSITDIAITDSGRTEMIDVHAKRAPSILHYSYGNQYFNKRNYSQADVTLFSSLWNIRAPEGSMSEFICAYLTEVKCSYDIRYSLLDRLRASFNYFSPQTIKQRLRHAVSYFSETKVR